jgi:hypothetical protein
MNMGDRTLKQFIVAFRIPKEEADAVKERLKSQPITGVNSVHQFFRKVGRDCVAGRLGYKNAEDALVDTELAGSG